MTKVISAITWIALVVLCVSSLAQEDSTSHWLSKGDELLEQALNITQNRTDKWSEPLRVDNELSNINSWREVHEKEEAALRPSISNTNIQGRQ
ncbi:MAG: hypothetical protein ACYDHX_05350 [Methanothrix sp.]